MQRRRKKRFLGSGEALPQLLPDDLHRFLGATTTFLDLVFCPRERSSQADASGARTISTSVLAQADLGMIGPHMSDLSKQAGFFSSQLLTVCCVFGIDDDVQHTFCTTGPRSAITPSSHTERESISRWILFDTTID